MKKAIQTLFILLILAIPCAIFASEVPSQLHGESKRIVVTVKASDSILIIEYCHANMSGVWSTRFDTLKLSQNKYIGKFSEIVVRDDQFLFKPGRIRLTEGQPNSSCEEFRNLGYLNYMDKQLAKKLSWTGVDLAEFRSLQWKQKCKEIIDAQMFKHTANAAFDSLCNYYSSSLYSRKFGRVVIKDYRVVSKKYIESSDSARIYKVWQYLSVSTARDRNLFPYLIQMPFEIAAISLIDLDVALMATPFVYPALIGSEIFVGNRLNARNTFKIKFYPVVKGDKRLVLKIRKSKIICTNYVYQLKSDIKTVLPGL